MIVGLKFLVLVDATKLAIHKVNIKLHNDNIFTQKIHYDFYPMFCSKCKRIGHIVNNCRVNIITSRGPTNLPRVDTRIVDDVGWQVVPNMKNKVWGPSNHGARSKSGARRGRSISCAAPPRRHNVITLRKPINIHVWFPSSRNTILGEDTTH